MSGPGAIGITVRDSALVARARDFLASGPAESVPLIEYVCQLPGAPMRVAERMARALFEGSPDFTRDMGGRWMMVRHVVRSAQWSAHPCPGLWQLSFAVVDVETTGTRAYHGDRITEIAAVAVREGKIAEVYETLVNPERSIPSFVTALTRITWDMVKGAPHFCDIAPMVARALDGQYFVAHNAAFDWRFVSAELERASRAALTGVRLCTVRLARVLLPQLRRRSLDSLAYYFGVEISARHRAAGDAVATAHILLRLLGEAESRGCMTREDLRALARPAATPRRRRRRGLPSSADGDFPA
jgi:DNA polymerase III subunit epsilon